MKKKLTCANLALGFKCKADPPPCALGPIYVFDVDCIKYSVTNPRAYGYGLCVRVPSLYHFIGSFVFKASSIKRQNMNDLQKVF